MQQEELALFDEDEKQGHLTGMVQSIFFEAPASFYKVAVVSIEQTDLELGAEVTITGNFPELVEGNSYYFKGKIVTHPKYGQQFQVLSYKPAVLASKKGVVAYLASDHFSGIGEKTAQKIVTQLGENAIEILLKDPTKAEELNLTAKQKESLLVGLKEDNGTEQTLIGLSSLGFSDNMAAKIFEKYHEKTLDILHQDPYRLAYEIEGIGFVRADQIAHELGFGATDPVRLKGALFESILQLSLQEGNTYTNGKELLQRTLELLEHSRSEKIEPELIADQLLQLGEAGQVISEDGRIYLKRYYYAEYESAKELQRLMERPKLKAVTEAELKKALAQIEAEEGITYGKSQKEAILQAVVSPVFLLTGGPGTGKTTIINGIVQLFAEIHELDLSEQRQVPILLAAPTGRAAKKMSESTGLYASTIHRLLGLNGREEQSSEEAKELEGALLIVDETSMVDTTLLHLLLQSIPDQMQVIFVGDKNQLPSVGPGQVFSDMLASEALPKKELEKIYRQGDGSTIISLAHEVKNGEVSKDLLQKTNDRSFISCQAHQVKDVVQKVVLAALKKQNKKDDIQLLAPMYRGEAGIDQLNLLLQDLLNPKKANTKEIVSGETIFRINDRVLHLVNDPENNIFNGDIGKVVGIEKSKTGQAKDKLVVAFDEQEVEFARKDLRNLTLAYCMSIHKSQGSEFPIVILPFVRQYSRMFARNLLYTALTRAKDKLILLGEPKAFADCIQTVALNRKTTLKNRLQELFEVTSNSMDKKTRPKTPKFILTAELVEQIDPMIGMNEFSPYDFLN